MPRRIGRADKILPERRAPRLENPKQNEVVMAVRVCEFEFEGQKFSIASMSLNQAEVFVEESKKLIAEASETKDWNALMVRTVAQSTKGVMKKSAAKDMDIPTLRALYKKILEFSGLRTGEVAAVSASPKSEAA
jgi:hypothetical protein